MRIPNKQQVEAMFPLEWGFVTGGGGSQGH